MGGTTSGEQAIGGTSYGGLAIRGISLASNETTQNGVFESKTRCLLDDGGDKLTALRFSWLKANFEYLPSTVTEREVMCVTQAYIMHMIGGVLMLDANNKVHLMCLPLLFDLYAASSYSWGLTVLATLYREIFRTKKRSAGEIDRYLILLQSWALYRISFLTSVTH
ncbi:hypothetical protein PVK06_041105 [Gossypium arboreum]|uniref:Aminotransferase-like plant mobile domain-containing protein n=1 Tax=Gossypium arboreum TaxID=29729 RepID=A0ABR0N7B1_GOSAR|nr:hypothetical protein PVK06_041105 [Gossypium arboreum]